MATILLSRDSGLGERKNNQKKQKEEVERGKKKRRRKKQTRRKRTRRNKNNEMHKNMMADSSQTRIFGRLVVSSCMLPCSGELWIQKLKSQLVRTQSLHV